MAVVSRSAEIRAIAAFLTAAARQPAGLLLEATMVSVLEHNGNRLDRPWMSAIAARCRVMMYAAAGDLAAGENSAARAIVEHDRLDMPFERARTALLVGQLQRRKRQKQSARAILSEALQTFEHLGNPLWAGRVRRRAGSHECCPKQAVDLTPSGRTRGS